MEEFRFKHISAGDLLRQEVAKETEQGKVTQVIMAQGKLVPPEITVTLLRQAILSSSGISYRRTPKRALSEQDTGGTGIGDKLQTHLSCLTCIYV